MDWQRMDFIHMIEQLDRILKWFIRRGFFKFIEKDRKCKFCGMEIDRHNVWNVCGCCTATRAERKFKYFNGLGLCTIHCFPNCEICRMTELGTSKNLPEDVKSMGFKRKES